MEKSELTEKKLFLNKPNPIVAVFDATLPMNRVSKHLFNYFLREVQIRLNDKFNNFPEYQNITAETVFKLPIEEINNNAGIKSERLAFLSDSVASLMVPVKISEPIRYKVKNEKDDSFEIVEDKLTTFVPLPQISINPVERNYEFTVSPILLKLLKQNSHFTRLNLQEFNKFKCVYSITMYEWLKRYEGIAIPKLSVTELRTKFNAVNKYLRFCELQKYVIDTSIREINEYSSLNVSYTLKKAVLRKGKIDEDSSYLTFFVENKIKDKEYNSFFDDFPENGFSSLEEELKYISDKYQKLCALFVENRIVTEDKFYEATEYISYYNLTKLYIYIQKQNIQTFNNIDLYSTCTTMLVDQNTKEKVAQSRRENQKKYLKELLARYETVATKIEVMAVIVKLKKLGFLARIRILENELKIREKKKKRFYLLWL